MTAAANLLAFLGLTTTLLLVWRQSWPARLPLFAAQSVLLAVLAAALAVLETAVAKLRLFRVPELLAGSFALALLSVTAVFLVP